MYILIIVIVMVVIILLLMYNSLVWKKNQVENSFALVETLLQKRYDLIPNLISAVKKYMQYEAGTLNEITELRTKAMSGNTTSSESKIDLNNQLNKALGNIMIAVENYPDLKASQNFLDLQGALNEVEEQLSASRRTFNARVTSYNNSIEMLPSKLMACMMGYKRRLLFDAVNEAKANVDVNRLFEG